MLPKMQYPGGYSRGFSQVAFSRACWPLSMVACGDREDCLQQLQKRIMQRLCLCMNTTFEKPCVSDNEGLTKGEGLSILYFIERSMKPRISGFPHRWER